MAKLKEVFGLPKLRNLFTEMAGSMRELRCMEHSHGGAAASEQGYLGDAGSERRAALGQPD